MTHMTGLLRIEYRPLDELLRLRVAENPKQHSLGDLHVSMQRFGYTSPVIVATVGEDEMLIAGHGRLETLAQRRDKSLGIPEGVIVTDGAWTVPTVCGLTFRNREEALAYVISDNQLTILGGWDESKLAPLLKTLEAGPGLAGVGFDADDLSDMMDRLGMAKPDEPEGDNEPQAEAISKPGDLWILGDHRLLTGDSTKPEDVARVMQGERAVLMATDPPYMVDYGHLRKGSSISASPDSPVQKKDWTDTYKEVTKEQLHKIIQNGLAVIAENAAIYVWHSDSRATELREILSSLDVLWHQTIVWVKPSAILTHCVYMQQHEPCAFGWKRGNRTNIKGGGQGTAGAGMNWSTVWAIDWEGKAKPPAGRGHPTMKPTEIATRPILLHTKPGDIVYEPFSGSGTQIIAAEQTKRKCRAIEIEPRYVDVAIARWERLTGRTAERVPA